MRSSRGRFSRIKMRGTISGERAFVNGNCNNVGIRRSPNRAFRVLCGQKRSNTEATEKLCGLCVKSLAAQRTQRSNSEKPFRAPWKFGWERPWELKHCACNFSGVCRIVRDAHSDPNCSREESASHGASRSERRSGGGARGARSKRIGCLRLAGVPCHLRVHRGLRLGLCGPAALLAPAWSFSAQRRDNPRLGWRCHVVGARRKSLSCARRELRKVAVHLPGVYGGGIVVVLVARR